MRKPVNGRKYKAYNKGKGTFKTFILLFLGLCILVMTAAHLFNINENNYPRPNSYLVAYYCAEYNLESNLVYAVMKQESNFNEEAVSPKGARGLMQLMEDAYDWVKYRLDDQRDNTYDDMYDPELNIQYGTYYLSYLMKKYDNSIELSAAAYHCGMGMVDGWLDDGTLDAENFNVDDIPAENDQTSHYVTKILNAYKSVKDNKSSAE